MTGLENVPLTGPLIVSPNHLHMLDIPLVGMCIRRRSTIMAADKWKGKLGGWVMEIVTDLIICGSRGARPRGAGRVAESAEGRADRLAVAPEGTRSRKPGLQEGHDGAAYLASRTGAVIVPVAVWGHEKTFSEWRRLRRPDVRLVMCQPITLPPEAARARTAELHAVHANRSC